MIAFARRYALSFFVYVGVGGTAALVEWSVFYLAIRLTGMHYAFAGLAGFAVATYVNYLLSSRVAFTRRDAVSARIEMTQVYLVSVLGLLVNLTAMTAAVEWLGLDPMIGKIGGTGVAFIWNYGARQFWVFSRAPRWGTGDAEPDTIDPEQIGA